MKQSLFHLWCSLLALIAALTLGGLLLLYMGESPLEVYLTLWQGAFGGQRQWSATLSMVTPYLVSGLAVALAFRCGVFNIGAEGQLFAGAMAGALVGRFVQVPGAGALSVIVMAALAGMLWALLPALLKVRFGVHEVINTIMMNYIMFSLCAYLVRLPAIRVNASMPRTQDVAAAAQLPPLQLAGVTLEPVLLLAVVLAVFLYFLLQKSRFGYELQVVGKQPEAARYGGIAVERVMVWTFCLSGGIAGLAGGFYVLSPAHPYFEMGFSPGWGFWGIALALLARNNPLSVIVGALLFAAFETGGGLLDTSRGIPRELTQILEAFVILMISSGLFPRLLDPEGRYSSGTVV